MRRNAKPIEWMGTSRDDLKEFPDEVRYDIGTALFEAQLGGKAGNAKPLKGFKGASVVEITSNHHTDTFRAVYTVRFGEVLYVLHCFQKKSKRGIATPKQELEMIEQRLRLAAEHYAQNHATRSKV